MNLVEKSPTQTSPCRERRGAAAFLTAALLFIHYGFLVFADGVGRILLSHGVALPAMFRAFMAVYLVLPVPVAVVCRRKSLSFRSAMILIWCTMVVAFLWTGIHAVMAHLNAPV